MHRLNAQMANDLTIAALEHVAETRTLAGHIQRQYGLSPEEAARVLGSPVVVRTDEIAARYPGWESQSFTTASPIVKELAVAWEMSPEEVVARVNLAAELSA